MDRLDISGKSELERGSEGGSGVVALNSDRWSGEDERGDSK